MDGKNSSQFILFIQLHHAPENPTYETLCSLSCNNRSLPGDHGRILVALGQDGDLESDVEGEGVAVLQVGERLRVLQTKKPRLK